MHTTVGWVPITILLYCLYYGLLCNILLKNNLTANRAENAHFMFFRHKNALVYNICPYFDSNCNCRALFLNIRTLRYNSLFAEMLGFTCQVYEIMMKMDLWCPISSS